MSSNTLRGVSELTGNVLMLLVATGLIAEAFLYGMPILKKKMEQATITYFEDALGDIASAMEKIAASDSIDASTTVDLLSQSQFGNSPEILVTHDANGYYIELRGSAQISHYAPFDVPLNDFTEPVKDGVLVPGVLGVNKQVVVTGRSTKHSGGIRNIMTVRPRPISSTSINTLIELLPVAGKSKRTTLPTKVYISHAGERLEAREENNQTVNYRIISLEVGFE